MDTGNLYKDIPVDLPNELSECLYTSTSLRIERIVSRGHSSAPDFWYDQDTDEFVILLQGRARLRFWDQQVVDMVAGDYLLIPAHTRHRVDWTAPDSDAIWLAVHYGPGLITHQDSALPGRDPE